MTAAQLACELIHAWCEKKWPGDGPSDGARMASTVFNLDVMDVFDHKSFGSYKYIPSERLTRDLGESAGAGIFNYVQLYDGSYVLKTCDGRLAWWSGKEEDRAEWG